MPDNAYKEYPPSATRCTSPMPTRSTPTSQHIQAHLPLPEPDGRDRTIGEVLALLAGVGATEAVLLAYPGTHPAGR